MSKDKPVVDTSGDMNVLMDTYRASMLPTPVLLWRTEGRSVGAYELTDEQYKAVRKALGK